MARSGEIRLRTLGIDLAAQDAGTAACEIEWGTGEASVVSLDLGRSDEDLLEALTRCDWAGIDCPFGWPISFTDSIAEHQEFRPWPGNPKEDVLYRATDRFVAREVGERSGHSITPLSVSANLIGIVAWRCAALLTDLAEVRGGRIDRAGQDAVAEVYPAAALRMWGLPFRGYKSADTAGADRRETLVVELRRRTADWLAVGEEHAEQCIASDDALDALLCALIARAVERDLTIGPPPGLAEDARREGWIHVPGTGSLDGLA